MGLQHLALLRQEIAFEFLRLPYRHIKHRQLLSLKHLSSLVQLCGLRRGLFGLFAAVMWLKPGGNLLVFLNLLGFGTSNIGSFFFDFRFRLRCKVQGLRLGGGWVEKGRRVD